MNIAFVSHCDFTGNSAMHLFSILNVLTGMQVSCAVCIPGDPDSVYLHGKPNFSVVSYEDAAKRGIAFPDGRGPDFVHAWTPRELVRKLTERLVERHGCRYLVHLEDNEDIIVEAELGRRNWEHDDGLNSVPEHRSHPIRSKRFLQNAAGITVLIDRLLEFKPEHVPGLVFWPGFDPEFLDPPPPSPDLLRRLLSKPGEKTLVYSGNIHAVNCSEVRSLFLAVRALRQSGASVKLLKSGKVFVDDSGWMREAISSGAVADLGFLPRAEIPSLLSLADVLVQPGRADDFNDYRFPSKLPEFFASGKPVLLPRSNLGRFVRDGVEAVVLDRGDALEIASQVERIFNDEETAHKLGRAGREFALRRLRWSDNVVPLKDFYADLFARCNQPQRQGAAADDEPSSSPRSQVKLVAFFLPQFHPIPENDEFWGKGFTEWTNVTRARPNFEGHYQPQLPADLGFYDLRIPEVLEQQSALARKFGIYGFCFYYYWFNGRKLLELPLENMLRSGKPDFPFCLCWANENWTRKWDGSKESVLIEQDYSVDCAERFIRSVIPYLKDPRYIRIDAAPMLLVYRVNVLPDAVAIARKWRAVCASEGIPRLHLCAVQSFGITDPRPYGFDAAVEFPPHVPHVLIDPTAFAGLRQDFEGYLEDYREVMRKQLALPHPDYKRYRGVMPAWDNTPRLGAKAHIVVHSSVEDYESWLRELAKQALAQRSAQDPIVFINAWNEWAEGAYLEPDQKYGLKRLKATLQAVRSAVAEHGRDGRAAATTIADHRSANLKPKENPFSISPSFGGSRSPVISYGTVRDYCDSFERLNALATANGDLKDCQRPWVYKAITSVVPRSAMILEIGAGEPLVANMLQHLGYSVWIVDPYDGSGNGPREFEKFWKEYPNLKFVRSRFHDRMPEVPEAAFDCIYSISVLEHVPADSIPGVLEGMRKFLKRDGVSIHAIDHVHRGPGADQHLANLRLWAHGFGASAKDLDQVLAEMSDDVETYYLSAESHNRWRAGVPYDQFPMRVCTSIQIVAAASSIQVGAEHSLERSCSAED
ncbi:MAG TPA: glycoside hydrolase family 99-like domain-containing protein [Bryobacteraceae bacterium]|nr:glycoside hydrolase family 99-like domain-containing protein [Bryobacteraceae bacterium]